MMMNELRGINLSGAHAKESSLHRMRIHFSSTSWS